MFDRERDQAGLHLPQVRFDPSRGRFAAVLVFGEVEARDRRGRHALHIGAQRRKISARVQALEGDGVALIGQ